MKHAKKLLSLILAVVCVLSSFTTAFATANVTTNADTNALSATSKAIVIVPGILGSTLETTSGTEVWLHLINYGKMALNEDGTSVYSIRSANYDNYGANNTYKTLYQSLNEAFGSEFDIIFFDYDFRLSNTAAATKLATELSGYSEVILVAHSMGGLVAGKYLANSSTNRSKTTALISLGTPYVGAAKAIDVMETGEMITFSLLGIDINLFKNTIKNMSKNCYAAYQLLPTSKYYSITGTYPLSVNGTNYSTVTTQLQKTAWGKKSDGTVKPMFSTATSFHSSLFSSGVHITDYSDVTAYTLAATGEDTISKVNLDSNYEVSSLTYSNAGDGTVLQKSAGYGVPNYLYSGTDHTGMVSDSTVISRIKKIITSETGVTAASAASSATLSVDNVTTRSIDDDIVYNTASIEIDPNHITINDRGWIESLDKERINIYADCESTLLVNGVIATEENDRVFDQNGVRIGSVWELGSTGRKMYVLYNGEYELSGTGKVKIEYMDDGYFDSAVEYNSGSNIMSIHVSDFKKQDVSCILDKEQMNKSVELQPSYVYTTNDLIELNEK